MSYGSFMNINEQAFVWNFWQKEAYSTKLALQHHSMRPHIASDFQRNVQSAKQTAALDGRGPSSPVPREDGLKT